MAEQQGNGSTEGLRPRLGVVITLWSHEDGADYAHSLVWDFAGSAPAEIDCVVSPTPLESENDIPVIKGYFADKEVDAICLVPGNFTLDHVMPMLADAIGLPAVLWGIPTRQAWGALVALQQTFYPFKELGLPYRVVIAEVGNQRAWSKIVRYTKAAALLRRLKGQRIGIFAGSGVGKSTLMGMMARYTRSDVSVIGLIGERGREVKEFIERDLGPEGLARSCVVAATSDTPPLVRLRGAYLATAVAEYFRDQGHDVILMLDSLTRFAMASREIGLAVGEPPTARGYTPSVFAQLPVLLERAGAQEKGSITGIYTVLVEGDDLLEPIADATRAILDGHIVLSRELADQGHYPAIDILGSISRLMPQVSSPEHLELRERLVKVMATYRRSEDLININAYVRGTNPDIDDALEKIGAVNRYLCQGMAESVALPQAIQELKDIFAA